MIIKFIPTKEDNAKDSFTLKVSFDLAFIQHVIEQYEYSTDNSMEMRFGKNIDLCFYTEFNNSEEGFILGGFDEDYATFNLVHFLKAYFEDPTQAIFEFETEISHYDSVTLLKYFQNLEIKQKKEEQI